MSPTLLRGLLSLAALVLGGAAQLPELTQGSAIVAQILVTVAGFLAGWAHMQKPGAVTAPPAA